MAYDPNCEETQAAVTAAVDEAVAALKTKNTQLIGELREARSKGGIDPSKVEALESQLTEVQTKLATAERTAKQAEGKLEIANKKLADETAFSNTTLQTNALNAELAGVKVAPQFMDAARALLGTQAKVVIEADGKRTVLAGDKPLSEYVKTWAESDQGKHFVAAANNGGGGGGGDGGAGATGKTMKREAFNSLDPTAQRAFVVTDKGTVVD